MLPPCDRLVPLREAGTRAAVLLVAAVQGYEPTLEMLEPLAIALQPERGLYAIHIDRTLFSLGAEVSIETLAQPLLQALAQVPPRPWIVAGYSGGAMIAYEAACFLQSRGQQVPLYVSLDGPGPALDVRVATIPMRARYHLRRMREQRFFDLPAFGLEMLRRRWRRAAAPPDPDEELWDRITAAHRAYQPRTRYRGPILFVEPEGDRPERGVALANWRRWSEGPVEALRVGGDLFRPPQSEDLARKLADALRTFP